MKGLPRIHSLLTSHASITTLGLVLATGGLTGHAEEEKVSSSALSALLEEVVVTARKREESAQDVPLSVSAYGSDQLEAMKVRDLTSLSVGMPNVALDDVGTTKGTANFSIRGLGINSSIPSIDPTVGIFVDGVYMGLNNGIIFDTFDLESVEVLRGPQGILFGRNVTGGAVLLNTKTPGQDFEASVRATLEGGGEGLNRYLMANVSGPLTDNLAAKLSVYTNNDDGWFKNEFTGEEHGESDTDMARAVVAWDASEDVSVVVRYEYSEGEHDGAAAQNHTNGEGINPTLEFGQPTWDRDSHKFSIDETGELNSRTNFLSAQVDWDVAFGDGTITNIFGWRDYTSDSLLDVDGLPIHVFHSLAWNNAEQYSNELRYTGTFNDNLTLTTGLYYFTNEINYHERRLIEVSAVGPLTQDGGGDYDVESMGMFVAADFDVTENLTLSAGGRYTKEEKEAKIASLNQNVINPVIGTITEHCSVIDGSCDLDFQDDEEWTSFSPKLGFIYHVSEETNVYGHWSRGFRSGGYNLRNTATDPENGPGPFDEEQVDNYELGFKMTLGDRGRLSGAIFYNDIQDMQREINEADGASVVQIIRNTADAQIYGIELDSTYALSDQLVLTASVGWLDAEYTSVDFDLNGDGNVDKQDENLDIPRAAELTYSVGLTHEMEVGNWGSMSSRINYAYRDDSAYTDNNLGFIDKQKILDAGIDFYSHDNHWVIGLYGKNLLDEVKHGGDTQLTFGTFSPLSKGKTYGVEVTYNY